MKIKSAGKLASISILLTGTIAHTLRKKAEKSSYSAQLMEPINQREQGYYEKYIKRVLDIACATAAIIGCSPAYILIAFLVRIKLGSPVLFAQDRPGIIGNDGKETIFKMYKFRTMTDEKDENGELLPDEERLTEFGKLLRATSLDELPEAFNILNGTMSVIGPRPQLVRDLVFMTDVQRMRHTTKPGMSGLAQINGRNAISWDSKIEWDLKYIQNISFCEDVILVWKTFIKVFSRGESNEELDVTLDYGDALLKSQKISKDNYDYLQTKAKKILEGER